MVTHRRAAQSGHAHPKSTFHYSTIRDSNARAHPCFVHSGGGSGTRTTLRGLLPTLKRVFYPSYAYDRATRGPSGDGVEGDTDQRRWRGHDRGHSHSQQQDFALRAGRGLDRQLYNSIHACIRYAIPPDAFVHPDRYPALRQRTGAFTRVQKALSKHGQQFWLLMCAMHWVPVACQLPVGSLTLRIGTACDVVVRDARTGELAVLEIKRGFESYYHRHTGASLCHLPVALPDSVYNQHQLQLAMTHQLYCDTFQPRGAVKSFLVRFFGFRNRDDSQPSVELISPAEWTVKQRARIVNALRDRGTD